MVDYCGALGHISPTDLGIKAARAALQRAACRPITSARSWLATWHRATSTSSSCRATSACTPACRWKCRPSWCSASAAPASSCFARRVSRSRAAPARPRCVVGTESMTRNPIAAFDHRTGFKLGAPSRLQGLHVGGAEGPGRWHQHDPDRREPGPAIRHHAATRWTRLPPHSFAKAVAAQESGFLAGEIVPVVTEKFELEGYTAARHPAAGQAHRSGQRHPSAPVAQSRCWPSCARCSRAACRPAATARRWSMPRRPVW